MWQENKNILRRKPKEQKKKCCSLFYHLKKNCISQKSPFRTISGPLVNAIYERVILAACKIFAYHRMSQNGTTWNNVHPLLRQNNIYLLCMILCFLAGYQPKGALSPTQYWSFPPSDQAPLMLGAVMNCSAQLLMFSLVMNRLHCTVLFCATL